MKDKGRNTGMWRMRAEKSCISNY